MKKIVKNVVFFTGIVFTGMWIWFFIFAICAMGTDSSHGSFIQDWISFQFHYPVIAILGNLSAMYCYVRLWNFIGKEEAKKVKKMAEK